MAKKEIEKTTVFDNIDPVVMEKIQSLRLIDDEMMTVVFSGDKKATEFLLKILLNREDLKVKKSMTQLQKQNLFGRSVKLDIVAEDLYKQEYNIEIQRAKYGAGARRIRYHQAMLDSHSLKKNESWDVLPNLYIIFILEDDLFGKNEAVYKIKKNIDIKDDDGNYLNFDDGCNIMYVNGAYRGNDPLGKLMHDFSARNADEMYYDILADKVRFHKQNTQGVQMASQIVEEYGDKRAAEALQIGIQQGTQQKAVEAAKSFYANGVSIAIIAKSLNMTEEQVREIVK